MCTSSQLRERFLSAEGGAVTGKPISRLQSMGVGFSDLIRMNWNGLDVVCAVCFTALPKEEKAVARVA